MEAPELVVTSTEQSLEESLALQQTESHVRSYLRVLEGGQIRQPTPPKLVFEDGKQVELTPRVLRALQFVLHHMASGDGFVLIPESKLLTTNEAARVLNVSRPFLRSLLDKGELKFTKIGSHHRLLLSNVLEYKRRRDQEALGALNQLMAEAQEAGDYFND